MAKKLVKSVCKSVCLVSYNSVLRILHLNNFKTPRLTYYVRRPNTETSPALFECMKGVENYLAAIIYKVDTF